MKILGIGNALVDILYRLDDEHLLSEIHLKKDAMTLINERWEHEIEDMTRNVDKSMANGGSISNTMVALARLGREVGYIGRVGDDEMGHFFEGKLHEAGVHTQLIRGREATGVAHTFVTPGGSRTFGTLLGAAYYLGPNDITAEMFRGYDLLHIEGYLVQNQELIEAICQRAKQAGLILSLDLSSFNVVSKNRTYFHHLISDYIDIVFANEGEARAFTGSFDSLEQVRHIAHLCDLAVVKLGEQGSIAMLEGGRIYKCRAEYVEDVVDTTAAGDYFAAGFLHALTRGHRLQKCLHAGTVLATEAVQVLGSHLSPAAWNRIKTSIDCR
ncbi:MAG: adenosine kinase [Bacteroidaceae bacterium]|nr:adenosine kinase [Bacteroidaceae bacterium]